MAALLSKPTLQLKLKGNQEEGRAKGLAYAPKLKTNLSARCPQCPSHNHCQHGILDSVLELELVALDEGLIWYQILISGSETGLPSVPFGRGGATGQASAEAAVENSFTARLHD
ncbi:hypothetical protein DAPPUDRAFT_102195 [Daphnia pulex]|uniref:Uncharacterized protein n=1 Tax=Daphnia pulex TaxID=6669 RepID=E9GFP2_DAPPU|nr:hypothetical protein DAPPUDRAFT_102195 [Daphnia pulex]|eukprot:EFX81668.1 hypothetical protein DAPPUDRAFT_102195 [Daphnia pulex]